MTFWHLLFDRLQNLGNSVLLDRLVARRQYFLAIQVAKYLRMPDNEGSNRILVHWAKYKVNLTLNTVLTYKT